MMWFISRQSRRGLVRLLTSAVLILMSSPVPVVAQNDDLARCAAATPQFPQACPCVIGRAEAAGITGATLSQLLSNNTNGVPIETFQSYGGIYVECIQEAVLGTAPSVPTVPNGPAPAPVPVAPLVQAPVVPPPPAANAGQWRNDRFVLRRDVAQASATAITEGGRVVSVICNPRGGAHLMIDGVASGPGIAYDGALSVLRGNGALITSGTSYFARVEGDQVMIDLNGAQIEALGAGAVAVFDSPAHGLSDRVGLSGSAVALRALQCVDRNPFQVAPVVFEYTGDWTAYARVPEDQYNGGYLASINTVTHGEVGLACGDHFHLNSFRGADPNRPSTLRVTVDENPLKSYLIEVVFNRGSAVTFEGVPEGFFRAVRAGQVLRVEDLSNGQGMIAVYDLSGLEQALQQINCPADAGTPIPPPPQGWHRAVQFNGVGTAVDVLRFIDGPRQIAFSCAFGAGTELLFGPIEDYRVLNAPATLTAGAATLEVPAAVDDNDMVTIYLPSEVASVLASAPTLEVSAPAFGMALSVALQAARPGIADLGCPPSQSFEAAFDFEPDATNFSGVDTQPWEPVMAQQQGVMLLMRGLSAPPDALYIGCNGRFALSAAAFEVAGDTLPVSMSVGVERYPRPARDFRRAGQWWVLDAPDLYADIVQTPFFSYVALVPGRPFAVYGTGQLDAARRVMCG
jgi:hypothetical protein